MPQNDSSMQTRYLFWPWVVYPFTMVLCLGFFQGLRLEALPLLACSYLAVFLGAVVVTILEYRTPHIDEWTGSGEDWRNDLLFMALVQTLLPRVLEFLAAVILLRGLSGLGLRPESLWPHDWPVGVQAVLMVFTADLLRYWLHRFAHENATLWKFHAVHHSPPKLYWVNVGRFHPVDKSLQFFCDALPFIIVGIGENVLALYFVFYAVNGFFQHSNVEMRLGILNYVISGAELHRWHHSREPSEANQNYGNNIIVWDLLFGTYFLPRNRLVGALGLRNTRYPQNFTAQLKTPFAAHMDQRPGPLNSYRGLLLNAALALRMKLIRRRLYQPLSHAAEQPTEAQWRVLHSIVTRNQDTRFGREHGFAEIHDVDSFRSRVPVADYENLRPHIEEQERAHQPVLTAELPVMYNQTSGTTGQPKYIPVLDCSLTHLSRSQKIFSYVQYEACSPGFAGRIVGLVSPAIDGHLPNGAPYGSASGHIYKTMPKAAKAKYLLPEEVFEIEDYDLKYYIIARLCLEADDVTYLGSANPSTFHRLLDVVNERQGDILSDIESGTCLGADRLSPSISSALQRRLQPNSDRAEELRELIAAKPRLDYADFWPHLRLLATWTGGSCGISLNSILPSCPPDIRVIELGYLASEVRGTITIDAQTNAGIPTIEENFFEFVEQSAWEEERPHFLGVADLRAQARYYVFVTTPSGLYRYNMNDIIEVSGHFRATPTIRFVQKGRGVTNITGEKLYESQVMEAMTTTLGHFGVSCRFYQAVADEQRSTYFFYLELHDNAETDADAMAQHVDRQLRAGNVEYEAKRAGNRLHAPVLKLLREGTYERYKKHCLEKGQRESQFKGLLLQYAKDLDFDWSSGT